MIEKSFLVTQEKIRILREAPPRLLNAGLVMLNTLCYRAILEALLKVMGEHRATKDDADEIDSLAKKCTEANEQLSQTWIELYGHQIAIKLYFGSDAGQAMEVFISLLKAQSNEQYFRLRAALDEVLNKTREDKIAVHEIIPRLSVHASQAMEPMSEELKESVSHVAECMSNHLKKLA